MPNLAIIRQNSRPHSLPDFRSLGVLLRVLLLCNAAAALLALWRANSWPDTLQQFLQAAALLQPVLLSCLLLLYALNPLLRRLPARNALGAVLATVVLTTLCVIEIGGELYIAPRQQGAFRLLQPAILSAGAAFALLAYFNLRIQALSPAIYQARLQALQARIRPHFLFNCINTVLSLVRADPRSAETALEDMSDLFRMAMAPDAELAPLRDEVELSRRYLELERLRLGDRLRVNWHSSELPADALVPPLMLQPLLENAVYHGIEPLAGGGIIDIRLERKGGEIQITVRNTRSESAAPRSGNKLALANIRERLKLLFDIEAQYSIESGPDHYQVRITLPYIKEALP